MANPVRAWFWKRDFLSPHLMLGIIGNEDHRQGAVVSNADNHKALGRTLRVWGKRMNQQEGQGGALH